MPVWSQVRSHIPSLLWWLVGLGLVLLVCDRLGVFTLSALVATADGDRWLPSALASVDHPFHIARAETLRRSLLDGELLRWIGHHQGGYPAEFYPLGVAWLEAAAWLLTFGLFSMPQVHTLVVALIFLAPGLAFLLLARQDGWGAPVAVVALALHVVVPGDWWHGGYTELVQWGLITNVGGAVAALFCLAWLSRYVAVGSGLAGAGAALAAAGAIYGNPRSMIALAAVGFGVWVTAALRAARGQPAGEGPGIGKATGRVATVGAVAGLLAAPELLSLVRFGDLYHFVRYERYVDLGAFLQSAVNAVSAPVFWLALVGILVCGFRRELFAARAVAVTALLYVLATVLVMGEPGSVLAQLEPTRLMPFQRLLTVYLAAVAIVGGGRWVASKLPEPARAGPSVALALLTVALAVVRVQAGAGLAMPVPAQTDPLAPALYPVERAAVPQQADFEAAIRQADDEAAPGTAVLVIGSALSWHQRLWAPLWTDRPLWYDNWLWGWSVDHAGTPGYSWDLGNHYPDAERALDRAYLERHGIGAVVVTGPVAELAAADPNLDPVRNGVYRVFLVRDPTTIVTFAGANAAESNLSPGSIVASGTSEGGEAVIRHTWFPRWQATVNGVAAPVTRRDDGFMQVPVPGGAVTLSLRYGTDRLDWTGRALAGLGVIGVVAIAAIGRRRPPVTG